MKLKFTKMHGAGNDFVVVDAISQHIDFTSAQWQFLADRRFGVGADQMLVVERPQSAGVDFRYRIYNADGGEVEQCGNGARAFVKFVTDKGLTDKRTIKVETLAGVIEPKLEADGRITVDMGTPILEPGRVPFNASGLQGRVEGIDTLWPLDIDGKTVWIMTGTGILKAFDFKGNELWGRDIQREYGKFGQNWGYGSSPLLYGDSLFVQVLHGMKTSDPSYLLRIDKATGRTIWPATSITSLAEVGRIDG